MRISDWSSDVCSSDLRPRRAARLIFGMLVIVVAIVAILLDMIAFVVVFVGVARTQRLLFGGVFRLFAQQRVPVFLRDLIIIGVDFRKGEEAVAVAAIIDEIGRASWRERVCQ